MIEAMKLAMAIQKRLNYMDKYELGHGKKVMNKKELIRKVRKAIGEDSKVSVIEWANIGKSLGVFNTKRKE